MSQRANYTLLGIGLLFASATLAVAEQNATPVEVEADRLELDQKSGISLYQGHVRLQRKETLLQAERLELHGDGDQLTLAVADGKPVHIEIRDEDSGKLTRGEAQHVEYRFADGRLELLGKAALWRDGDRFTGNRLIYDDKKQVIRASGEEKNGDRVQIILQPEKESQP